MSNEWQLFALARDEVMRARLASEEGAGEWLRQKALCGFNGEPNYVRVRYTVRYFQRDHGNLWREAIRYRRDHGDPPTGQERDVVDETVWRSPIELFRYAGPAALNDHNIKHETEWHVGELKVALGLPMPPQGTAKMAKAEARGRRGPKIKDFWPKVLGYAAGWLAEKGEAPSRQSELEKLIASRIEALGDSADASTVRMYAREMLVGFKEQLDGE